MGKEQPAEYDVLKVSAKTGVWIVEYYRVLKCGVRWVNVNVNVNAMVGGTESASPTDETSCFGEEMVFPQERHTGIRYIVCK